ncbi:Complex I-15 kDa [Aphelenchoides fujianensis]|nr:Complex I-15 kDa [Aphelenchoides fujianensis]
MGSNQMPEMAKGLNGIFNSKFTDALALPNSQQGQMCAFFESQFYRCMEAYGSKLGRKYCDLEHRDLHECVTKTKQIQRSRAIQQERMKQYVQGKRPHAFEDNHPPTGDIQPDYFSNNRLF